MYVAVSGSGKARVIQFREDRRIPGTNKKKHKVIKTIGNYENMLREDPDILNKLRQEAITLTKEKKESTAPLTIQVASLEIVKPDDVVPSYFFGHALVKQIWKGLFLDKFFTGNCNRRNSKAVAEAIYYLVAHRCSSPDSILATAKDQYDTAGIKPLGLDVFYDVLDVLSEQKEAVIAHLCDIFEKKTTRHRSECYLDVTTYSFESTRWGELRMFGFSKDHKNNEVQVVMALLIDNNGIPITYELFPGNTVDQNTLARSVEKLSKLYNLEKITVVADRGLNGGENLVYLNEKKYDFVISYTLKRSKQVFKDLVFHEEGWSDTYSKETGELIYREKVVERDLKVKVLIEKYKELVVPKKKGRPRKYTFVEIPANIHLTWTASRAKKDRADRERIIERLIKRLDKPYQIKASIKRGCNQYLQMSVDLDKCSLDIDKIKEAELFDGYYAVVTNNKALSTEEASEIYKGLWKIEESFRILKTDLNACPVFVWDDEHVKGHFVMCYVSLCLTRYIQYLIKTKTKETVSTELIMQAIKDPVVLVQGEYPYNIVTPTQVTQLYIDLAKLLDLPPLKTNMTLTQFRSSTKLDLSVNLK